MLTEDSLTTGTALGSGLFETLMKSIDGHLTKQHDLGRITGSDYSNAYIGAMTIASQTSLQYILGYDLVNSQVTKMDAETSQLESQIEKTKAEIRLVDSQIEKTKAEIEFLKLKSKTERAQTETTVDGVPIAGSMGKQIELLDRQIKAFKDDALIKLANTYKSTWEIRASTDDGTLTDLAGLNDTEIRTVLDAARIQLEIPKAK